MGHDQHRLLANGVAYLIDAALHGLAVVYSLRLDLHQHLHTHHLIHTHIQHTAMAHIHIQWALGDRRSAEPARRVSLEGASHHAYCYACSMLVAMLWRLRTFVFAYIPPSVVHVKR
jgi:hypothetical protein